MTVTYESDAKPVRRPMPQAIWRGLMCRCPNCGKGKL